MSYPSPRTVALHRYLVALGLQPNTIKLGKNIFHVGWVERSETHQAFEIYNNGGFRYRSTHPTNIFGYVQGPSDKPSITFNYI